MKERASKGPPEQIGGSERGPGELDRAKANRGLGREALVSGEDDPEALASGQTEEEEQLAQDEGDEPGEASKPARREQPRARSAEEDARRAQARSEQPGGDRPSEGESPNDPASRWGRGPRRDEGPT